VEISHNRIDLPPPEKAQAIRAALSRGLVVWGEAGKKNSQSESGDLVADIQRTLEAGVWKVLMEAMEPFDGKFDEAPVESISRPFPWKS